MSQSKLTGSGWRVPVEIMIWEVCKWKIERSPLSALIVSKGKSTVAVRRPGGEVVLTPFQVEHNAVELSGLVKILRSIGVNTLFDIQPKCSNGRFPRRFLRRLPQMVRQNRLSLFSV